MQPGKQKLPLQPTRALQRDMLAAVKRWISSDWQGSTMDVYCNEQDLWVVRCVLDTVDSIEGLHAYMNVFVRCNQLACEYGVTKVRRTADLPNDRGPSSAYAAITDRFCRLSPSQYCRSVQVCADKRFGEVSCLARALVLGAICNALDQTRKLARVDYTQLIDLPASGSSQRQLRDRRVMGLIQEVPCGYNVVITMPNSVAISEGQPHFLCIRSTPRVCFSESGTLSCVVVTAWQLPQ